MIALVKVAAKLAGQAKELQNPANNLNHIADKKLSLTSFNSGFFNN